MTAVYTQKSLDLFLLISWEMFIFTSASFCIISQLIIDKPKDLASLNIHCIQTVKKTKHIECMLCGGIKIAILHILCQGLLCFVSLQ